MKRFSPNCSTLIRDAPGLVAGAPKFTQTCCPHSQVLTGTPEGPPGSPRGSQTYYKHCHRTSVQVIINPSYSERWPECPPRACYSPVIDASKFTLHINSDTPGGFQRPKSILLMHTYLNVNLASLGATWL
jgi:hypothetical protein